jgi:hypothetical protein
VTTEVVEEAVVVETKGDLEINEADGAATQDQPDDTATVEINETVDDTAVGSDKIIPETTQNVDTDVDDVPEDIKPDPETSSPETPEIIVKKRGFVPLLLGGVLCAGLGYAGANFLKPEGWPFPGANTTELQDRLAVLEVALGDAQSQSAQMAEAIELVRNDSAEAAASVDAKISEIDLSAGVAPVEAALAALDQRLTAVEAAPVAEAIVSPEATAAYERQLQEMQSLLDSEVARLKEAKVAAENEEANAAKASAVARLQEAITTGRPYADILDNLNVETPEVLRNTAAKGVSTLQEISEGFEVAADLAIVETAKIGTENQGWVDRFLRTQLGLRSLTPQDGMSADAIMSRAQQALRDNDLQTALTEISTLPDVGQAVMADWVARTQTRLNVTNALSAMLAQ